MLEKNEQQQALYSRASAPTRMAPITLDLSSPLFKGIAFATEDGRESVPSDQSWRPVDTNRIVPNFPTREAHAEDAH
jgi:hypothetical protein